MIPKRGFFDIGSIDKINEQHHAGNGDVCDERPPKVAGQAALLQFQFNKLKHEVRLL
ncbi:hypothetical protein D3C81_2243610 [compost metagenome]